MKKSAKCDFFLNLMKKSLTFRLWQNSQEHFKLVEHGNGQLVEVLILTNQSDKTVSVLFVLLIALDSLFQNRDFSGKLGLFLFVLSVQSGVSAVGQLSQKCCPHRFYRAGLPARKLSALLWQGVSAVS